MVGRIFAPVSAVIKKGENSKNDQGNERKKHVPNRAFITLCMFGFLNVGADTAVFNRFEQSIFFCFLHRAEVTIGPGKIKNQKQAENSVKVVGNRRDESLEVTLESAGGFQRASHGGCPGGNRCDDTHRSCGRVDDVGQFLAGDTIRIGERFHDRTDCQAVEVVIDENEEAQTAGGENGSFTVLDFLARNLAVLFSAAGHVEHIDKRT